MTSVYGPILTGDIVRLAVVQHLQAWMPAYIAEIARQRSIPEPAPIRSWASRVDFATLPGEATPTLVVVAPGLTQRPVRHGDGTYDVEWAVGVGVITMANTDENTMALAELYTAAARSSILQHRSISGLAADVSWEDERYDDRSGLPMRPDDTRSIAAGQVMFIISISQAINTFGAPATPPANVEVEPPSWPTVSEVLVTTERSA